MKIIAKTETEGEYLYLIDRKSAHYAPDASAAKMLSILNSCRFQLKNGEIWKIYDYEYGCDLFVARRFIFRKSDLISRSI